MTAWTDLAVLTIMLGMGALVMWSWRQRGHAIFEARRAQHLEAITSITAELLGAAMIANRLSDEMVAEDPGGARTWIRESDDATRLTAALMDATRIYVTRGDVVRVGDADAYVRIAFAVSRSEGRGVLLTGDRTELRWRGTPAALVGLVTDLVAQIGENGGLRRMVTIDLRPLSVVFSAEDVKAVNLAELLERAKELGWELHPSASSRGFAVSVRSVVPGEDKQAGSLVGSVTNDA